MNHLSYHYNTEFQCIVVTTEDGKEVRRLFVPFSDLSKIALICYNSSIDRFLTERE